MRSAHEQIREQLALAMIADRRRLGARFDRLCADPRAGDAAWGALRADLDRSLSRRRAREAGRPRPAFTADLPVLRRRDDIARVIRDHQVCVVCGETGSGKTTQLPQICLDVGLGVAGMIGHTQPRRIAARAVAARLAEELRVPLGRAVGFKVRFTDEAGDDTHIKVMTDGILLAETQGDRLLEQYDAIIIDEAHERSLNIDFLLGYLKRLLPKRPDLKVIITSATIDPARLSEHFGGSALAPVIEVSGRTYPVEVRYRPPRDADSTDADLDDAVADAVIELCRPAPAGIDAGDILVFLPGEREIRSAAAALRERLGPDPARRAGPLSVEILPLYARLSPAEQMRVFQPHAGRRVVLATNVAETSLTVPGVRGVVDTGLARISRYSHRTRVQRLPIEAISRASAAQRAGRCGRVGPGICIRLYDQRDFEQRPEFTEPEILRTNLAGVILRMKALDLGDPEHFPFVEPPDARQFVTGYESLFELGALDAPHAQGALTPLGRSLARLPVDPRIGRMLLAAADERCLREVLVIAAALSVQDPRDRPLDKQPAADDAHLEFRDETSDFLSLLRLWAAYHDRRRTLTSGPLRAWCRERFISPLRMREWEDVHHQLARMTAELGLTAADPPAPPDAIHRALLTGLLSSVATRAGDGLEYAGPRGTRVSLWPGSVLFRKAPRWVMAAEFVQTTRLYARTVARIQPEWIEALAPHVLKRSHSDAHWHPESGEACAFERATLFGLTVVPRRRVPLGPVDPARAREIFIEHALVDGDPRVEGAFVAHNEGVRRRVRAMEARLRRSDLLADAAALGAFFDARLPPDVCSRASLRRWLAHAGAHDPEALCMTLADALAGPAPSIEPERFPDAIDLGLGAPLPVEYAFAPGDEHDGITARVPLESLGALDPARAEWLIPGWLPDKVTALIKALPKPLRGGLPPAELTSWALARLEPSRGDLRDALSAALAARGVHVPRDAWPLSGIPEHLRLRVVVVDEHGREVAAGRDAAALQHRLAERVRRALAGAARAQFGRSGLTAWDFDDLPERVELTRAGVPVVSFPCLVDEGTSVTLTLADTPAAAAARTARGVRRLFALAARDELRRLVRALPERDAMLKHHAAIGPGPDLDSALSDLIAERVFLAGHPPIRTRAAFDERLNACWGRLGATAREIGTLAAAILAARHDAVRRFSGGTPRIWAPSVADIREQLAHLTPPGFLAGTPLERLREFPRYLAAVSHRLAKLRERGVGHDAQRLADLAPHWKRFTGALARLGLPPGTLPDDPEFHAYRWLLEEFRVALFAQEIGAAGKVSARRLDDQWARVRPDIAAPAA